MKIEDVTPPLKRQFQMTFDADEGWSIVAALLDYAHRHSNAENSSKWRSWANELDGLLRERYDG